MDLKDIKRRANAIRKCLIEGATHYYDRTYGDLKVADLLLILEDENYHTEEIILEALATLDYYLIIEACQIETDQSKEEYLTKELDERRQILCEKIRNHREEK